MGTRALSAALRGAALLGVLACGGSGPSDAERLAQAAALPVAQLDQALALCAGLDDEDTAGQCALSAVIRALAAHDEPAESLCARLEAEPWRSECWFLAAEDARRQRDPERAGALCAQAGPFVHDCGQHLWQGALQRLAKGVPTPQLTTRLAEAQALFTRWDALLGDQSDLDRRFWMRFFAEGFDADPVIDPGACAAFPDALQVPCRQAAAQHYLKRLRELTAAPGGREALCGLPSEAGVEQAAGLPGLAARPHPGLEEALRGARGEVCQEGPPQPDHRLVERVLEAAAQP